MPTSTPALTRADFSGKFAALAPRISDATLDLINRSETLKQDVRDYEVDTIRGNGV